MESKRFFSSRQSLPMLGGAVALALVALLIMKAGDRAVAKIDAQNGAGGGDTTKERDLVTIRIGSKLKLKRASWGPITVPEKPAPTDPEEIDPHAKSFDGLDIAVVGRR